MDAAKANKRTRYKQQYLDELESAKTHDDLYWIGKAMKVGLNAGRMDQAMFSELVKVGKKRRAEIGSTE